MISTSRRPCDFVTRFVLARPLAFLAGKLPSPLSIFFIFPQPQTILSTTTGILTCHANAKSESVSSHPVPLIFQRCPLEPSVASFAFDVSSPQTRSSNARHANVLATVRKNVNGLTGPRFTRSNARSCVVSMKSIWKTTRSLELGTTTVAYW